MDKSDNRSPEGSPDPDPDPRPEPKPAPRPEGVPPWYLDDGPPGPVPPMGQYLSRLARELGLPERASPFSREVVESAAAGLAPEHFELLLHRIAGTLAPRFDRLRYRYCDNLMDEYIRIVRRLAGARVSAAEIGVNLPLLLRGVRTAKDDFGKRLMS